MEITDYITKCVNENIPISFLKFGDGEYNCAFYGYGRNCDNDSYTMKLSDNIKSSFKYIVEKEDNTFIGLWHDSANKINWEALVNKKVNWVNYHTLIIDKQNTEQKVNLYKAIKNSKSKKIIVCNNLLLKSKYLFDADYIVNVPLNNWFDTQFDDILCQVKNLINSDENHIVITCCGMSSKVLITELRKSFKNGIYLDFGSAIDFICTKRDSRGREYNYEYIENLLSEILPNNWNDKSFEYIYNDARNQLGIHL